MENSIYNINGLRCGYKAEEIVLEIDHLSIPKGKLIFVVGVSGGGKSTLIETLGLMNHTTQHQGSGGDLAFLPSQSQGAIDLLKQWDLHDREISDFRKKHFSFIFQSTNLMPNFSGGENMMVTALLAGKDEKLTKERVKELMKRINLPERAFEAKIQLLSGGQRQRLAFIRALVSDYTVLFGDEPTGNLDAATAIDCFSVLKEELQQKGTSGIIVSHDLSLATRFGDQIVPITLSVRNDKPYGRVLPGNLLYRTSETSFTATDGKPLNIEKANSYLQSIIFEKNLA